MQKYKIQKRITSKAEELGADLAGFASVEALKKSPSHYLLSAMGDSIDGEPADFSSRSFSRVEWPSTVRTVLIIALSHPETKPELDWFHSKGNTIGNRMLMDINKNLSAWIEETEGIKTYPLSYYVEKGGVYLKDAAILAGMGCLGRNNSLITPEFGPLVRLRAMFLEAEIEPTGPINFDPCNNCQEYCRKACPQEAFDSKVTLPDDIQLASLPARDAFYRRAKCMHQMSLDWSNSEYLAGDETLGGMDKEGLRDTGNVVVKHCRQCELACPAGSIVTKR